MAALLARQKAILHGRRHPEVHVVIGAAALHQEVGSRAVMEEQLRALAAVASDSGTCS